VAVAVPGIGMIPAMRLLPPSVDPRGRKGPVAAPQSGHTRALRSMSPRQEGHIRKAELGLDSREPNIGLEGKMPL